MSFTEQLIPALGIVFSLTGFLAMVAGVIAGIIIGVLPGFGGAQALALMFPFTLAMPVEAGILLLVATYTAAEYGGSIPAILIKTPGTTAAAITVLEGYPMAQSGRALRALHISLYSGVFGGILSSFAFLVLASSLAWVGLQFGPGEMFAVGIFGLSVIASFLGTDVVKGFIGVGIGLLLAMVGSSSFGGLRFTFGQASLLDGLPLVVVIMAFMAMPEVFALMSAKKGEDEELIDLRARAAQEHENRLRLRDLIRLIPAMTRGTIIGTAVGAIPGPGATVSTIIAYAEEKRRSRTPQRFGTGVEEGVASPEAANNAVVSGSLIPALALGIPGSGAIAILLALLISKGIAPGPMLFQDGGPIIVAVFYGLIAASLINLAIGIFGMRAFAMIAAVPRYVLAPFVLVLIMIGAFAYQAYIAHLVILAVLGAFAVLLDRFSISPVPIVLAFVMGPIVEQNLSRALSIHGGDLSFMLTRPICLAILFLSVVTAVLAFRRRPSESSGQEAVRHETS